MMTLGELIKALEAEDPALLLPEGFTNPHSYRGYYDELAFEPAQNVTVGAMLADARSALGATYEGWKGGEYTMKEYTDCWLAMEGTSQGDSIGPVLLRLMIAAGKALRHDTGLRLYEGENWAVAADMKPDPAGEDLLVICRTAPIRGQHVPAASLRRIGWVDQKGRVYTGNTAFRDFDGGSLTPLLIDPREDGH